MTDDELYQLVFFVKRPGMYLGNHEIKSIEGFLIGYDMAKNNETNFQQKLIKNIFENYRQIEAISNMEKGNGHFLFRQIEEISRITKLPELQIFKDEAIKCLVEISDKNGEFRYKEILKTKLKETINEDLKRLNESEETNSHQMSNVVQICKAIEEWKGENLSLEIRTLVTQLKDLHINEMTAWMKDSNEYKTNELATISNRILEKIAK